MTLAFNVLTKRFQLKCVNLHQHIFRMFVVIVHGGWGGWEGWTQCSVTCGNGIRSRARSCDSPAAAFCHGIATESEACNEQQCPGLKQTVVQCCFP